MKLTGAACLQSRTTIFIFKMSFKYALHKCILINHTYLVLIIQFYEILPHCQERERWLFYFSGNLGHMLLFLKCLIIPLFKRMVCDSRVYLDDSIMLHIPRKLDHLSLLFKIPHGFSILLRSIQKSLAASCIIIVCQLHSHSPALLLCLLGVQPHHRVQGLPVLPSPPATSPQVPDLQARLESLNSTSLRDIFYFST